MKIEIEGIKKRMFYGAAGKTVSEYLAPFLKARKESRPARPTWDSIAEDMTQILQTKHPFEKVSISLVQFWSKKKGA